jgi:hypothetical protein
MSGFLLLILSTYVVFFIFDIAKSYRDYSKYSFLSFDKPTKSWWLFFIDEHKLSIVSILIFVILGLIMECIFI